MKYSVFDVARSYCEAYRNLTAGYKLVDNDNGYNLFSYCMKTLYGIETNEYSPDIYRYAERCVKGLSKVEGTPRRPKKLKFESRLAVVNICQGMYAGLTMVERGFVGCQSSCRS